MIADKAEAEEKERRRIAPFGYINKKEDFAARFPKTDFAVERNCEWLERVWAAYRAKVAFIQEAYDDKATRDRLYAHIYPNTRHDDSDCCWIGSHKGVEGLLVETQRNRDRNRKREKHGFDSDASMAFEDAPEGIAAYLAAPPSSTLARPRRSSSATPSTLPPAASSMRSPSPG